VPEDQGLSIAHAASVALSEAPSLLVNEAKTGYMRQESMSSCSANGVCVWMNRLLRRPAFSGACEPAQVQRIDA
jgi:hypothetical protein